MTFEPDDERLEELKQAMDGLAEQLRWWEFFAKQPVPGEFVWAWNRLERALGRVRMGAIPE